MEFTVTAGLDDRFIDYDACEVPVHRELVSYLETLRGRAHDAGFELAVASGFRSFERQLTIWNAKAQGRRPLLDDRGQQVAAGELSPEQRLFAILRWSALPGGSRHHWGTDIDVFDAEPSKTGYQLQLTCEETEEGGVYGEFHKWLTVELARADAVFFRPYQQCHGGVAPEPWHLSCRPLVEPYQQSLRKPELRQLIAATDIALQEQILAHFDEIYERFVVVQQA